MLPTIIANIRHTKNSVMISVVNLCFGWTVLGWIAALLWAVTEKIEEEEKRPEKRPIIMQAQATAAEPEEPPFTGLKMLWKELRK